MLSSRFWRIFVRDFGLGLLIAVLLLLLVPGGWEGKLFAVSGTLVIALLATFVEARAKRETPAGLPSFDQSTQRGLAAFPTTSRLRSDGVVLGALTEGPYRGRHFVIGMAEDRSVWWGVQGYGVRGMTIWQDSTPHEKAREIFDGWGARFLPNDRYAHSVLGSYFPELVSASK